MEREGERVARRRIRNVLKGVPEKFESRWLTDEPTRCQFKRSREANSADFISPLLKNPRWIIVRIVFKTSGDPRENGRVRRIALTFSESEDARFNRLRSLSITQESGYELRGVSKSDHSIPHCLDSIE